MHNTYFFDLNSISSRKQYFEIKNCIKIVLIISILLICQINSIIPSSPIVVSPNTQSSPSNFIFNFILSKQLESTGYLMITFAPFSVQATPKTCMVINSADTTLLVSQCVNLQTANGLTLTDSNYITVNKTWINSINPNIDSLKTIVIRFNKKLNINQQYSIQIITDNKLPALGSITSNFQFYTISGTGFMIEQNWNFGQVYFEYKQNNILTVNSLNDLTKNYPGTVTSNAQFQITIKVNCPTPYSRLKFVISNDFQFSASSRLNIQGIQLSAPQVIGTQIISKNIIIITFSQSFVINRKFKVSITDTKNPLRISRGYISIYYLPYNSMSPLQVRQQSIHIGTRQYIPAIQVLTGQGLTQFSPMQFYQQKQQYLTVNIILPRQCNNNFVIQISTDVLIIYQGTTYAKASTVLAEKLLYDYYSPNGVRISGFPNIPSGSKITATFKVWIPNTSKFNVFVSIDQLSALNQAIPTPIIKGSAAPVDTVGSQNFISGLSGNNVNEVDKLILMTSTSSYITFTVSPTSETNVDSSLYVFTSKNVIKSISFNNLTSCLVGGIARTCTLDTTTFTKITINSGSSNNFFPINTATTIRINNIVFLYASSNTEYIYQFYFELISLSTANPIITKTVILPQIIPQRNIMTGFQNYFSNDLQNTTKNYLNIFRIVSTLPTDWNYIIQSTQKRIITIFAKQKWTNLFTNLKSGDEYPFLSSITDVKSTFIQGTTTNKTLQCPLNWDLIHLILPGIQNSTKFSISIPITYNTVDSQFYFQIMMGIYNTQTRVITYKYIQPLPQLNSVTYKQFSSGVSVSSKPKQLSTKIQLNGYAGSYKNSVNLLISPTGAFSGNSYSSSVIITSAWNWFDSSSVYNSTTLASTNPQYQLVQQKPLSIKLGQQWYLTYIPFKTTSTYSSQFNITFDNIKLPYTHDLPYYSVLLINQLGAIDSYNQFINQDQGVFYQSHFKKITFICSDNSLGVKNTDCSISFIPYQQIQIKNKIYVTLIGLKVSTDKCVLQRLSDSSIIPLTCNSNRDKNQLIVSLLNTQRLPSLTQYTLKIYGIEIQNSTIIHYTDVTIRDNSGGYIIQKGSRILLTSVSTFFPIYIQQLTYLKNNPIVVSGFKIIFTLPRQLNKDQVFTLVMSNDLSNLNAIPCKLNIKLYLHNTNTQITNIRWFLNTKNYQIVFQQLQNILTINKYRLQIYGMKTPSTISQDIISLIYLRTYDSTYTVQNTIQSTATYPSLVQKVNSLITINTFFNTEGLQQPMLFTITNQFAQVNSDTVWYITLPRYYSQQIWDQSYLIYCRIDNVKLTCQKDINLPYTIKISKSPKIIDIGIDYKIQVNGVKCPRKTYANSNPLYVTESIFFGVATSQISQSYIEYSQLYMVQSVINPQQTLNYGTITITQIISSNIQTHQTTFFTIKLKSTININPTDMIYIKFPKGFDNFNDMSMEGDILYANISKSFIGSVINTRIGLEVPSGINVTPNTQFILQISSLPTPKTSVLSDMNKIQAIVTQNDRISTKGASLQLHNLVQTKSFFSSQLHLVINNYNTIQLTAGTFSDLISITSSDNNPFLSNIKVQFISTQLTFQPQPSYLLQGDYNGKFRIGAQQTLIPTVYTFEIIKSQTSISAFYTALSRYSVRVTNSQIPINIPSTINIPKGGCSVPFKIQLLNAPFQDLQMKFQYDSFQYTLDQFWVNYQISYNQFQFNKSITDRWLSFCCSSTFSATSLPLSIYLGGTNVQSYTLSTKNITINIIPNTTTITVPTLTLTVANTQKTYAKFNITTNINGILFYQLKLSPLNTPLQLLQLKNLIKKKSLILQSQKDYLNKQIYTTDRDHRINLVPLQSGISFLEFQNLLPQRPYTLCVFYQNQHRNNTQRICQSFTMQNWGVIKKYYIKFSNTLFQNQLNNVLCYFSKASNSQITQVVDLQGKSCSLNSSANNYQFSYKGSLVTNQLSSTIIYHITDQNLTTDPSSSAFSGLYDANGITSNSLNIALANFSINYISQSHSLGSFNPIDVINLQSQSFRPLLLFTVDKYIRGSYTLYLKGMTLSKPGSLYLILTPYKKIIKNQISGHVDIQIRPLILPSYEQILNCKDGYNQNPISCQRVVIKQNQSIDVKFNDIQQNRMYAVFYLVTNEYPLRPIVYGKVGTQELLTVVSFENQLSIIMYSILVVFITLLN